MPSIKQQVHSECYRIKKDFQMIDEAILGTMKKIPSEYLPYVRAIARQSFQRGQLYQAMESKSCQELFIKMPYKAHRSH